MPRGLGMGRQSEPRENNSSDEFGGVIEQPRAAGGMSPEKERLRILALTALGVVYGDIGTSPLYAVRECFKGDYSISPDPVGVLGVLSLIIWSLIIVISIKYLAYVLRADNRGEGGILALLALVRPRGLETRRRRRVLTVLGLVGAAMLYGDGTITPAISVLSAIEGLEVESASFTPFVVPLTVVILVLLFLFQQRGTAVVGSVFGPTMLLWFLVLAALGIHGVAQEPAILGAFNPMHAVRFFPEHGLGSFSILAAVVLVVTGGEALYADMGHFGKRAIRLAWYTVVLPALLLNYLGQGAELLQHPQAATSPFYLLAPDWAHYPLVALATVATIIASQAIISGAFSLTHQAIQLGYSPRMRVVHTSAKEIGQIYVPAVNWLLMVITIVLVLGFERSTNLAAAYGLAVTTTMVITTILAYVVSRQNWGWSVWLAVLVTSALLIVDLSFFGANLLKIIHGGWVPVVLAAIVYLLMSTWWRGRHQAVRLLRRTQLPLERLLDSIQRGEHERVPGAGVYLTGTTERVPLALSSQLAHFHVLHKTVVLLTFVSRNVPYVRFDHQLDVNEIGPGIWRVIAYHGFMQSARVSEVLLRCEHRGLHVDPAAASYFIGHEIVVPRRAKGLSQWRAKLFAFLSRNALAVPEYFGIPEQRVIAIGVELEV